MTREEQINGLYELKQYLMDNPIKFKGHNSLPITLLDYAIKALEQEPFDEYGNYKFPSDIELTEPNTATSMSMVTARHERGAEQ